MNRTAGSYNLKHGIFIYVCKEVNNCMKTYPFRKNNNECTSNNSQKVFIILVSYFDIEIGESVLQHYQSISLIEVNAKFLLESIYNCFVRDDIPFENLVSDLSDSTRYVKRGGGKGWEEDLKCLLRRKAPQLLDIDGEVFHRIHNTVKQFCKPFKCFDDKWIDYIHWGTKCSTDILDSE